MKRVVTCITVVAAMALAIAVANMGPLAMTADAFDQYSQNRDATNCRACHGDFRAAGYVSRTDGSNWGSNLHDPHRNTWLGGNCNVCHQPARFPVSTFSAPGAGGLPGLSCTGCHDGEGLRLHHIREAGVVGTPNDCNDCHAPPVPQPESVNPPFYGSAVGQIPADACNTAAAPRNENKFGSVGLDNDGDGLYDGADPDCRAAVEICDNGTDDDGDGLADCADPDCGGFRGGSCTTGQPGICSAGTFICQNLQRVCVADNAPAPEQPPGSAVCQDGLDNDCDGLTDTNDTGCQFPPETNCFDGVDNNGNGLTDCADPSCANATGVVTNCGVGLCSATGNLVCSNGQQRDTCVPGTPVTEGPAGTATCSDGEDNDCDGLTDASDPDCQFPPEADCFNGIDDNGNGLTDCADPSCATATGAATTCGVGVCARTGNLACSQGQQVDTCVPGSPGAEGPFTSPTCSDGLDNDCDGLTDAADLDSCSVVAEGNCFNGIDDNGDGLIDCADPTCANVTGPATTCGVGVCAATGNLVCTNGQQADTCTPGSPVTEGPAGTATCQDGLDNDCDGLADANDPDCAAAEICDNGIDDDGDGLADCADPDCAGFQKGPCQTGQPGICADGTLTCRNLNEVCVANQQPVSEQPAGSVICQDALDNDCDGLTDANDPGCQVTPEADCFDGIDNNGDGLIDCADPTCANATGPITTCGVGVCSSAGNLVCFNGQEQNTCTPLPAGTEGPATDPTCSDGLDNDCDGLMDEADPGCQQAPSVQQVDIDIEAFNVSPRIDVCPPPRDPRLRIALVAENESRMNGCADATVVGVLGGTEVYRVTQQICLNARGDRRFTFPEPNVAMLQPGTINWNVTINDGNPDNDMRTATTRVVCVPSGRDRDRDDD